ncbi:MAG: helix-turn-helix domain-containing protein [Gordonibacter sp.]|uniref:helix-turn-helix domain-containing protein n=1 Tax=Gordonibacter sp. TaxID=1968902 RepID=UPI002FC994D4
MNFPLLDNAPAREGCRMVYLSEKPAADAPEMLAAEPELLTVQRMHELTGVSEQVIRKEIAEGRLPGCKIGRRLFVPKHLFVEYATGGAANGRQ